MIGTNDVASLAPKWVFTTHGDVSADPAVVGGAIYFPDWGGYLNKVDAKTGNLIWERQVSSYDGIAGGVSRTGPAVVNDVVYIGDQNGAHLMAIDATTGNLIWSSQMGGHPTAILTASPLVVNGVIYQGVASSEEGAATNPNYPCCTFRGSVVAVDAVTGGILWKTYTVPDNGGLACTTQTEPGDRLRVQRRSGLGIDAGARRELEHALHRHRQQLHRARCGEGVRGQRRHGQPVPLARRPCRRDHGAEREHRSDQVVDLPAGLRRLEPRVHPRLRSAQLPEQPWARLRLRLRAAADDDQERCRQAAADRRRGPEVRRVLGARRRNRQDPLEPGRWARLVAGRDRVGSATDRKRIYIAEADPFGIPYTVGGQTIYWGSWAALDPNTGKVLWQTPDPSGNAALGFMSTANGVVYAPSMSGNMYALDPRPARCCGTSRRREQRSAEPRSSAAPSTGEAVTRISVSPAGTRARASTRSL